MGKTASLTYKDNNGNQRAHKLRAQAVRIGRLEDNDLAVDNPYISRFHAEINFDGSDYSVFDLGSTSGTYVNDQQVIQHKLIDGDRIRLGRGHGVEFVFRTHAFDDAEDAAEDPFISVHPVRVISPEEARFINVSKLPKTGDLSDKTVDWLRALYEFTSQVPSAHSSQELCEELAAFLFRTLKAERCAVLLYDGTLDLLDIKAACPSDKQIAPSRSVTDRVYSKNVAVFSLDARKDARFSAGDSVRFQSIHSVMCAPIGTKSRLYGVSYVDNLTADRAFDDEELEFLTAVSRQVGLALENLYLIEEQRRSLESFIRTLAATLDARDDSTAGHSARVGAYASGIARVMGLREEECRMIYYAGLLHDYGKIGIRDDVLLKPAVLTPEEYEHIKQHPQHTFRLLSKMRFPEDLADIPRVAAAHHEHWDGTGYPSGLVGEEIPLGSRIIAVADAYDALVEERVYSEPLSPKEALSELVKRSALYFDPQVIAAFTQYFTTEIEPRRHSHDQTLVSGSRRSKKK